MTSSAAVITQCTAILAVDSVFEVGVHFLLQQPGHLLGDYRDVSPGGGHLSPFTSQRHHHIPQNIQWYIGLTGLM